MIAFEVLGGDSASKVFSPRPTVGGLFLPLHDYGMAVVRFIAKSQPAANVRRMGSKNPDDVIF